MVRQKISQTLGSITDAKKIEVEFPENAEHGDYTTNVALQQFSAQPQDYESPRQLAEDIVKKLLQVDGLMKFVAKIEVAGPGFINFWLKEEYLVDNLKNITQEADKYGAGKLGQGQTVVIDYSAPNIAKTFGIGHLRSTIIGQALYNLYKFLGYKVVGDNHLGDWGTQFGKLLYMIDKEGKTDEITLDWLEKKYVEFHRLAQDNESLEEAARQWFKKLEDKDPQARAMWTKCVDVSLSEFNRIYDLLGVKIDFAYGESFYESLMPEVIAEAKKKRLARQSQGAWVIEIEGLPAPLMLVKQDGATTYATRDLATLKFRKQKWNPEIVIYEVGVEQALHFLQVFAAARLLGYVGRETKLVHTKHGLYTDPAGRKLSTRKGESVKLEGILLEAVNRARKLGSESQKTARAVGIGAVKYFDLKHAPQSNIAFDWEKMFELEGNSGPYLQYTVARAKSVLRKAKAGKVVSQAKSLEPEETEIIRQLQQFPEMVIASAQAYAPNILCEYLYQLAQKFNTFYNKYRIIGSENVELRLKLTSATAQVLQNGLKILGIETPEKM